MSKIICGHFDVSVKADAALQELLGAGFTRNEVDSFYTPPPGQNNLTGFGGDVHSDAGARKVFRAEGTWRNGSWLDFDPRSPLAAV
jgi:hypothetical protein